MTFPFLLSRIVTTLVCGKTEPGQQQRPHRERQPAQAPDDPADDREGELPGRAPAERQTGAKINNPTGKLTPSTRPKRVTGRGSAPVRCPTELTASTQP